MLFFSEKRREYPKSDLDDKQRSTTTASTAAGSSLVNNPVTRREE
jgi:hypothetical protein